MELKKLEELVMTERQIEHRRDVRMSAQIENHIKDMLTDNETIKYLNDLIHNKRVSKDFVMSIISQYL